jgi:hypothetical protein
LRTEVKAGHYSIPKEVLEEALELLQREPTEWNLDALRAELDRGVASLDRGEGIVLQGKQELRAYFDGKIGAIGRSSSHVRE